MIKLERANWKSIIEQIDENDLAEDGVETELHVTLLYGLDIEKFDESLIEQIKKNVAAIKIEPLYSEKISLFENDDDVLKFDVCEYDNLQSKHNYLKENYPNVQSYPDYSPHITIAYLKKGKGKKYINNFKAIEFIPTEIILNLRDKGKFSYKL
jgi:2'-5' RNA ligase